VEVIAVETVFEVPIFFIKHLATGKEYKWNAIYLLQNCTLKYPDIPDRRLYSVKVTTF